MHKRTAGMTRNSSALEHSGRIRMTKKKLLWSVYGDYISILILTISHFPNIWLINQFSAVDVVNIHQVKKDEGIRASTTLEGLAKLKPAFKSSGSTTAGNSSQVSDGAGAVLLARRSAARRHNLPVLGIVRSYAVKGVPAEVMGIGPAFAIPAALSKIGMVSFFCFFAIFK